MKVLTTYYWFFLIVVMAFAFVTRIYRVNVPERYIFDEVYHAVTAKLIAANDPRAYEWWNPAPEPNTAVDWLHPPLAKYTQAWFIFWLGPTSFAWRLSSVLFGTAVIGLTAWLADELFHHKPLALLAATLAALDGLLLVQSRIAMNDIHVTFFILLTFICYHKYRSSPPTFNWQNFKWLYATGLSAGLAMGSKWSGVFGLALVSAYELSSWTSVAWHAYQQSHTLRTTAKRRPHADISALMLRLIATFGCLILLPILLYVLAYSHMFWQGKSLWCFEQRASTGQCYAETFSCHNCRFPYSSLLGTTKPFFAGYLSHFGELHYQIWYYQTHLTATHTYQSRPWEWFLNLRPVWYHVDYTQVGKSINMYAFGNPALFWLGASLVVVTVIAILVQFTPQSLIPATEFGALVFVILAYGSIWLPWQLSPRIMFFYHYTPAVPLLAIIVSYWLIKIEPYTYQRRPVGRVIVLSCVAAVIISFVIWYPHWTGLPVPQWWATHVYFALPSWK